MDFLYIIYICIGIVVARENFALAKDRKKIQNKFMELEAFNDTSAVTLEQLGIEVVGKLKSKKETKEESLYRHFKRIMKTKLIVAYGDKFYFDLKVYKRQQMNIYIMISFTVVFFVWGAYITYLNW